MNLRKFSTHVLRIIVLGGYNLFLCGLVSTSVCKTVSPGSTYLYHAKRCAPVPSPPPTPRCYYSYLSLEPTEIHIWELIALVKKRGQGAKQSGKHWGSSCSWNPIQGPYFDVNYYGFFCSATAASLKILFHPEPKVMLHYGTSGRRGEGS